MDDVISIANLSASGVYEIRAALHLVQNLRVKEMFRRRIERSVNGDYIADFRHFLGGCVESQSQLIFNGFRAAMASSVVKLNFKRLETAQYRKANPAGGNRPDMHAFKVIGTRNAIRNVPATLHGDPVRWEVVSNKGQNHHDCMFSDTNAIRGSLFSDGDACFDRSVKVDMVRPDSGCNCQFQFFRLLDSFRSKEYAGQKGCEITISVSGSSSVKHRVRPVLIGSNNEGMSKILEIAS